MAGLGAGNLQNNQAPLPVVIPSPEQPAPAEPETPRSLQHCIGLAAAACRAAILQLRAPGQVLAMMAQYSQAPYLEGPLPRSPCSDVFITNWNQCAQATFVYQQHTHHQHHSC